MELAISIVTPSFNQAAFLPECLESVLNQTHAAIEHLVYDPGSSDGSQDVIRRYPHATLIDEPDKGQSDAVSKGFLAAKGDIIGWVNSDDYYASDDVFATVINRFLQPDAPDIVYGRGAYTDDKGNHLRDAYVNESPETLPWRLQKEVGILQPTLFLRKSVIEQLGVLSEELNFGMDYEYWIRAMKAGLKFAFLPKVLAFGRYYEDNKTLGKRGESLRELCDIIKNQFNYASVEWIRRYAEFNVEKFDSILADSANRAVTNPEELKRETRRLLVAYNTSHDTLKFLKDNRGKRPYNNTVQAMEELGITLEHPFHEIPLSQKTAPYCYCHTVTERRWAFKRDWRDRQLQKTQDAFEKFKEQRKKDTCIIVGNGPSLNETDFSLLKDQDVFITNYAFLNKELLDYAKYLGVVNYLVAEQGAHQFNLLEGVIKLFPYWLGYCINGAEDTFFFASMGRPEFSKNMFDNVSWRSTVSFFQMQIAYSLGYRRVLMIGFDHNYSQDISAKEGDILVCDKDDDNHFDPRYFKGKRWQAADVDNMEAMYVLAKQAFEEDNREIVNCTVGGKLELFKRGKLEDYVGETALKEQSDRQLLNLRNAHLGERCVIIGNNSDLEQMDLSFLSYDFCFGFNQFALQLFEQHKSQDNYFVAIDDSLLESNWQQLKDSSCIKFLGDRLKEKVALQNDIVFLQADAQDDFSLAPQNGVNLGNGSSYIAMQLAYYMGFKEVILLGFEATENAKRDKYFKIANLQFRANERVIIEASTSDRHSLFPQQNYQELFLSKHTQNSQAIYIDDSHFQPQDESNSITIFTIPKSFDENGAIAQRNAILSWKLLGTNSEIILFGDAEGTAEIARELSLTHIPQIDRLGKEMLLKVKDLAQSAMLAYVEPDTILLPALTSVVSQVSSRLDNFLVVGRCWEINDAQSLNLESVVWTKQLEKIIENTGCLGDHNERNYFIFSRLLVDSMSESTNNDNPILNQSSDRQYSILDSSQIDIAVKQNCELFKLNRTRANMVLSSSHQLKSLATKYLHKVSIVIVAHNQSANIVRAIKSILLQTVTDYEIIVVDNVTGNTREAIEPYRNCIKYVREEQQGFLNACNRGAELAKGEFILFLEADEYLLENSLSQLTAHLHDSTLDLLLSGTSATSDNNEPWHQLPELQEDLHIWQLWKLLKPLNNSVMLLRRSLFDHCGGFDSQLHQKVAVVDLVIRLIFLKNGEIDWLKQTTCGGDLQDNDRMDQLDQLAKDFETVINNYLASPNLKPWMKALESRARYNNALWSAWLMHINSFHSDRDWYLQRSLTYSSSTEDETAANWHQRFNKFAKEWEYSHVSNTVSQPLKQ